MNNTEIKFTDTEAAYCTPLLEAVILIILDCCHTHSYVHIHVFNKICIDMDIF